ncbi:DNA-binding response regulator [Paenibacillus baekrokdamisoli]|uniref:DNA-binding response regulator n=1 Tax=Paenibacillus baekrokdamisoli TaxID=1712516 RepID=A0A3G9IVL3_9BACL|nr:response regulator transcription factor [Paenibacillus baekrokdamisoli]MBB3068096.1 DNA-binding NarL/FixJ family response regulator [Paenibacillus baekrokdamisoli]BBH22860.1 DNA-binding response regulator [Paenibacillus baekrokdamisoli]
MTIRLLLADDHAMVRRGLQVFLATQSDIELVGEAANGQEALDQATALQPDVILMDLNMPILNGIETTKQLKLTHPDVKVIVLTSFSDQDHVLPAIRAGARGYLLKDIEPEELVNAIRRVRQGQVELHPEAAAQLMNMLATTSHEASTDIAPSESLSASMVGTAAADSSLLRYLTRREQEVLGLIARGMSNKEIGSTLHITEKTVKTHVSHLLDKLGLVDRTQAALYAVKHGLG